MRFLLQRVQYLDYNVNTFFQNFFLAIPVAPKTIRKDDAGSSGTVPKIAIPAIRVKPSTQITSKLPIAPMPSKQVINIAPKPIAPKPAVSEKPPDFSMLNKPPPIPFYLPKSAALVPRNISIDNVNDPPEIALKRLEKEATTLKEEVAALKWLAKRKEQEWNNIIELLKKKEETWLKVKRQAELAATDKAFQKFSTVIPNAGAMVGSLSTATGTGTTSSASGGSFSSPVMPDPPPPIQIFRSTASNKTSVSTSAPVITLASAHGGTKLLKSAKNLIKKFVKLTVHTFACNILKHFLNKYEEIEMTGNGNHIYFLKFKVDIF